MKVERIDHIHIAVRDLDVAIQRLQKLLGTSFSPPITVQTDDIGNDIGMTTAMSPLGLEVLAPTSPNSAIRRFVDKRGEGLHAICFKVDDIDAAVSYFEECGLRLVGRQTIGKLKEAQFYPKDSFGFMIELCEYPEKSSTYIAAVDQD